MRKLLITLAAIAALGVPIPAMAQAEVCPEQGKVESTVDGDIDGIVLEAGTEVCIKGGQTLLIVVADGGSTLAELLGTGQNVSHYTVLATAPTTTVPEESATTVPETATTAPGPEDATTATEVPDTPINELPRTGVGMIGLALSALAMLGIGVRLVSGKSS